MDVSGLCSALRFLDFCAQNFPAFRSPTLRSETSGMPRRRRQGRRRAPQNLTTSFAVTCGKGVSGITLTVLGIPDEWPIKLTRIRAKVCSNDAHPDVVTIRVNGPDANPVAYSRPVVCTNVPQPISLRVPYNIDFRDWSAGDRIMSVHVVAGTGSDGYVTLAGTAHFIMSSARDMSTAIKQQMVALVPDREDDDDSCPSPGGSSLCVM